MVMVVAFLALAVPVVTAALALAGTLARDSGVKEIILERQYANLGIQEYLEEVLSDPDDWQDWIDSGCNDTITLNGEDITITCSVPGGDPGDSPSASSRQFRTFKVVTPSENPDVDTLTTYTYTITVVNASGDDNHIQHGHLGHGYWKQPHHFDSWMGYDPDDNFNAVFAAGPNVTLLEALREGGGHEDAFNRVAVTALLNAAHPDISYPNDEGQVIAYVQAAYATPADMYYYRHLLWGPNLNAGFTTPDPDDHSNEPGIQPLRGIYDGLPVGFEYIMGSTMINGVASADPVEVVKRDKPNATAASQGGNLGFTYWRNVDHFASWVGYAPTDRFMEDVFGVGPANKTLLDRLGNGGGGGNERVMQREAVAALLNASNPDIVSAYDAVTVKTMVINAYNTGDFNTAKNLLHQANVDAYFNAQGRSMLFWDLTGLDIEVAPGELLSLSFDAEATAPEGNYCNEAWVEPGYKDHDTDEDAADQGRGTGTDMTARVKVGAPLDELCPGEAIYITTTVDQEIAPSGASHRYTYTIQLENVGVTDLHIAQIDNILPSWDFTYVPGSTSGLTNADPDPITDFLNRPHMEWSDPFTSNPPELEAGETLTLSFQADATLGMGNYKNELWIYFVEYPGLDDGVFGWPTGQIQVMDVFEVTATDSESNVIGTYQVWVGTNETIIR